MALSPSGCSLSNDASVVDELSPKVRDLVREFGWSVVRAYMDAGVNKPNLIRHLIYTTREGSREPGNKYGATLAGARSVNRLDEFLLAHNCVVSARALIGLFRRSNLVLVPIEPPQQIADLAGIPIAKLRKAIRMMQRMYWPFLDNDAQDSL